MVCTAPTIATRVIAGQKGHVSNNGLMTVLPEGLMMWAGVLVSRYVMEVASGEEFDAMRRYWKSTEGRAQLTSSKDEGIGRVREGGYAFIMEAITAKYAASRRPCDLVTVGEQFGVRSYGFAVPKSMSPPELNALNTALLEMHELGDIEVSLCALVATFLLSSQRHCKIYTLNHKKT